MTDEVKKIQQITDDAVPEFPISRKGGYLEEAVDTWLTTHYDELKQIIEYQNYSVEVLETVQAELDASNTRLAELEAANIESEAIADIAALLADAEARAEAAETRAADAEEALAAAPTAFTDIVDEEAFQASSLLQNASRLAREHVEAAKNDADNIREDAESDLITLRQEIEHLEGVRFATFQTLSNFFQTEFNKLHNDDTFAGVEVELEAVEEAEAPELVEEAETLADEEVEDSELVEEEEISTNEEATSVIVDPSAVSNSELLDELDNEEENK